MSAGWADDDWADDEWVEPDDYSDVDYYVEHERLVDSREPFTFQDERDGAITAAYLGNHDDIRWYAERERRRREQDEGFWAIVGVTEPLTRADLEAMRALDAVSDRCEDDCDPDADDGLPLTAEEWQRLCAIGRRLHQLDLSFWRRLRRFGPTPSLVVVANELLFSLGVPMCERGGARRAVPVLRRRRVDLRRSRGGGRRARRSSSRRTVRSSARSGDSGDGSDGEPAARGGLSDDRHVNATGTSSRRSGSAQAVAARPHGRRRHDGRWSGRRTPWSLDPARVGRPA